MSALKENAIKKIFFLFVFSGTLLLTVPENVLAMVNSDPAIINVDTSQILGEMPQVLRPGLMGTLWDDFRPIRSEVSALKSKPFWRLHFFMIVDTPGFFNQTKPENFEENFKEWLNTIADPQLKQFQDSGYQLIISLAQVPKWLSLYPSDECLPIADGCFMKWMYSPPKDYVEWSNFLQTFVSTQRNDGIRADYIIGDEPDWMFYGTEDQYLEFYSRSVEAIKRVDPNIKVGGPGVGGWGNRKVSNCPAERTGLEEGECPLLENTMIQSLITYVGKNNIALDFIDWHFPNKATLPDEVKTTRGWLKEVGLPETLPLTIGEWVFSSKGEAESTEKASAFAIHLLKAMMDNGIDRYSATSIYDQTGWESGDWAHVGFFSFDGLIRTKWNAFKTIDKLSGQRTKAETTDEDHIVAISFKENRKVTILISYFITPEEEALQAAIDSYSDQSNGFVQTCTQDLGVGLKAFFHLNIAYLTGQISLDGIKDISINNCGSFPDYLKNDLIYSQQTAYQVYNGGLSYQPNSREVTLKISNMNPGTYDYKKYIIDGDMNEIHSNPCRYNKKTESSPSNTECGIHGALDQAVEQAKNGASLTTENYLLSRGYPQTEVNEVMNCIKTPYCNLDDLVANYCEIYPSTCTNIENDSNEAKKLHENLFYQGTFTVTNGATYTIPSSIAQINNLKEVSLEGSKQEKQLTLMDNGTYRETFMVQPYSVILIEISPVL